MMIPTDQQTLTYLQENGVHGPYDLALIIGSGLGGLVDHIKDGVQLPYSTIPGFPRSTVSGHAGTLVTGRLGGLRVLAFQGRAHYYETGKPGSMRLPIAVCSALGIPSLFSVTGSIGAPLPQRRYIYDLDVANS